MEGKVKFEDANGEYKTLYTFKKKENLDFIVETLPRDSIFPLIYMIIGCNLDGDEVAQRLKNKIIEENSQ